MKLPGPYADEGSADAFDAMPSDLVNIIIVVIVFVFVVLIFII